MKATEIKLTYESIDSKGLRTWIGLTFSIENESIEDAAIEAKNQLKSAMNIISEEVKKDTSERKELTMTSTELKRVCQALANNQTGLKDLKDLQKYFILDAEVFNYLQNQKLI